jgi:very-short-patch-repair endonuclease
MTRAETLLWRYLRAHHIDGLAFRRQVPLGHFIADFVCHAARLVVEIDGGSHDFQTRRRSDQKRDHWFASQHFAVFRFTNEQVLKNLDGVIEVIRQTASTRLKRLPPSLTLPHKGGGNDYVPAARKRNHSGNVAALKGRGEKNICVSHSGDAA